MLLPPIDHLRPTGCSYLPHSLYALGFAGVTPPCVLPPFLLPSRTNGCSNSLAFKFHVSTGMRQTRSVLTAARPLATNALFVPRTLSICVRLCWGHANARASPVLTVVQYERLQLLVVFQFQVSIGMSLTRTFDYRRSTTRGRRVAADCTCYGFTPTPNSAVALLG